MSPLLKNLLIALVGAVVIWFGYQFFFAGDDALTVDGGEFNTQASRDTQEFLKRLQQLRAMKLDTSLFSDGRFRTLVDHRREVLDEPVGRSNPFAPAGQ